MKDFFTEVGGTPFVLFGPVHITVTIITIIIAICIFVFQKKLKEFKYKDKVRYVLAGVLLTTMFIYYTSFVLLGTYDWRINLPLHFCFITVFSLSYILLTANKKLYKVIYFFTFAGPIPAMIWPDLAFDPDRFLFWQYVISHHFMILSSIYLLVILEYKISKHDILKAFAIGNILVMFMAGFNGIFKTNYMMMGELPAHIYRLYPFVKYMPPIFWLEFAALMAITLAYIPAYFINRRHRLIKEKNINEI